MSNLGDRNSEEILAALPYSIRRAITPAEEYEFLDRV